MTSDLLCIKIVILGPFAVGKTTYVQTLSDRRTLLTDAQFTDLSSGVDHLTGTEPKNTTTVVCDVGSITIPEQNMVVNLFGGPGQERFRFMWDELIHLAFGVVVLVDTRDLEASWPTITYCEQARMPFVIAVNEFEGAHRYTGDEVSDALELDPGVPVISCDARDRASAKRVLITLVQHRLSLIASPTPCR